MPSIDRADWHYDADNFPDDLPMENGATHIAMFVRWAIERGLFVDDATPPEMIEAVRTGKMSARDFVLDELDGKLWPSMLTDECASFAEARWNDFIEEYAGIPFEGDTLYHVEDTEENYRLIAAALDKLWSHHASGRQTT